MMPDHLVDHTKVGETLDDMVNRIMNILNSKKKVKVSLY